MSKNIILFFYLQVVFFPFNIYLLGWLVGLVCFSIIIIQSYPFIIKPCYPFKIFYWIVTVFINIMILIACVKGIKLYRNYEYIIVFTWLIFAYDTGLCLFSIMSRKSKPSLDDVSEKKRE